MAGYMRSITEYNKQQEEKKHQQKRKKPQHKPALTPKKTLKKHEKKREKSLFKNEQQKERFEDRNEKAFFNHEKQNLCNYLVELLNDYERQELKKPPTRQEIEATFTLYNVKEISIDIIIDNLKQSNDHISGATFQDLRNYYIRNYDTQIKKAISIKNYKQGKDKNNLLKSSIVGFLIGRYFDKIVLLLVIGFFFLLYLLNG